MKITTKPVVETPKTFKPFQLVIEVESVEEARIIKDRFSMAKAQFTTTTIITFFSQLHDKMLVAIEEAIK